MRIGLAGIGIGPLADPAVLTTVARQAEASGYATLWAGEHVVLFDRSSSHYPYAEDGRIAVPPDTDWADPLVALTWAAAATSSLRLATGILLLPEHQPLVVAKQAASLDALCGGRLVLGVGIGWSKEEFAALGVPFEDRARRSVEYVEALRRLWSKPRSSMDGAFVRFPEVASFPKPLRGTVPVLFGGNGPKALARAAAHGDGWYGFNIGVDDTAARLEVLRAELDRLGRAEASFEVVVAPFAAPVRPSDLPRLAAMGVDEVVLAGEAPTDPAAAGRWVEELASGWVATAGAL